MSDDKRRILVVDDEPVIRLFLQELFEDEGYDVRTADTIADGLTALRESAPHLVVTDKNLPDGTGFEIVHAARSLEPPSEAMVITGYASLDSAVMALQIGAYDYILKPIDDVDLLLEKARKAMEKQELWRQLLELRAQTGEDERTEPIPDEASPPPALEDLADDVPQLMKLAELGSLIPMLAHEMRQPLAGIKGHVDLLLHKRGLDPPIRHKLDAVRDQVVHMTGLVESLTSYSRIATGGESLVPLERAIDMALSIFPVLRRGGRYEFSTEIDDSLPCVRGNLNAIQQVIVNLVKNAKDALDEAGGGRLKLKAWHDADGGLLKLRIEDDGPGIPQDVQQQLFQPFFTTKQEGIGTGLGLTICRQIMAEHGGRVEVQSPASPAGGAAFTLVFPAASLPATTAAGTTG